MPREASTENDLYGGLSATAEAVLKTKHSLECCMVKVRNLIRNNQLVNNGLTILEILNLNLLNSFKMQWCKSLEVALLKSLRYEDKINY